MIKGEKRFIDNKNVKLKNQSVKFRYQKFGSQIFDLFCNFKLLASPALTRRGRLKLWRSGSFFVLPRPRPAEGEAEGFLHFQFV